MKQLPAAQDLHRGSPAAFKALMLAIDELQRISATKIELIQAGIVRKNSRGTLYNPSTVEKTAFNTTSSATPDAPTGLSVTTTSNLAFLSWTIPPFQPSLAFAEVWELAAPAFREDTDYVIGDFVTYSGTVYYFTSDHTAGIWNAGHVSAAGAGDLVIGNANTRHQTPVSSAIIPLDIIGGTSYFWVRLISQTGVSGEFSSSTGITASAKSIEGTFPIGGTIIAQTSPGSQWLEMNGQTVSRATYLDLWSWISGIVQTEGSKLAGQYGDGDGSTTFSLPDYRGRVLVGMAASGTFNVIGKVGGAETHTLTTGEMPVHSHGVTDPGHVHTTSISSSAGASGALSGDADTATTNTGSATTGISIDNAGSGGSHNNLQPYAVDRYWVRALP